MKILVTGSKGQLGKTFGSLFSNNNQFEFLFTSREDLDISIEEDLKSFFETHTFAYCINFAAYTNVEEAEKNSIKAFEINALAVKNLALLCQQYKVKLLHISTDYVFDGEAKKPYKSSDKTNPINKYGESKLAGEKYIQEYLESYFIIRTSWLYSKKYGQNFYKTILKKAKNKEKLSITCNEIGCPTNTENLSKYIYNLIAQSSTDFGIKHYCDSNKLTWYEFAIEILKEHDLLEVTNIEKANNYVTFAKRPKYSVLENSK